LSPYGALLASELLQRLGFFGCLPDAFGMVPHIAEIALNEQFLGKGVAANAKFWLGFVGGANDRNSATP